MREHRRKIKKNETEKYEEYKARERFRVGKYKELLKRRRQDDAEVITFECDVICC